MNSKVLIVAAIAAVAVIGTVMVFRHDSRTPSFKGPVESAWAQWKVQHGKTYGGPEEQARFNVFKLNHKIVTEHNAKGKNYTLALNKFADLTSKEFAALYTGALPQNVKNLKNDYNCPAPSLGSVQVPDTLDWRTQGRVGPVKDQGQCGSCWAFSTTGSLEGLAMSQGQKDASFSEQELVDCSTSYGNFGCGGGWVQNAYHYVIENGIASESDYGYNAVDGTCKAKSTKRAFNIKNCANVAAQSVDALKQAVQTGPVSIYVEADQSAFQFYSSGVVDDASCFAEGQIDHAVLLVGYDTNSWIVKNSWASSWGNEGYIQISTETKTSASGICGIISLPNTYPTA